MFFEYMQKYKIALPSYYYKDVIHQVEIIYVQRQYFVINLFYLRMMRLCQSGRSGLPAKELCLYGYRGFESLPLRKIKVQLFIYGCKSFLFLQSIFSGYSVARSSRLLWEQEVAGSNPATPTFLN